MKNLPQIIASPQVSSLKISSKSSNYCFESHYRGLVNFINFISNYPISLIIYHKILIFY